MFSTPRISKRGLSSLIRYNASKELLFGSVARKKMLDGCSQLADAVAVTLGPGGRTVLIDQTYGEPKITKDGVTVAKAIDLADKPTNLGASLVKSVASRTNDEAGDGTTTATVLARTLFEEGLKKVEAGLNPTELKKGIDKAVAYIVEDLKKRSIEVKGKEAITNVATISANGDRKIGEMIGELYEKVGSHGTITCQEGKTLHHEVEYVDGLRFDRGYISPYFITDPKKQKIEFENAFVLLNDKKINNIHALLPFIEFAHTQQKPLLIIAEDIESEILGTLIINKLRNNLKVAFVKSPSYGENQKSILEDIAVFSGGEFITEDVGNSLEKVGETPEGIKATLGVIRKVEISKDDTILMNGQGDKGKISDRAETIKSQIKNTTSSFDKEKFEERLAKLQGGIGVIKIGGGSEVEVGEIKDRVTDALCATRAAIAEGIVVGGGAALLYASRNLETLRKDSSLSENEKAGVKIVQDAIKMPLRIIAKNAGFEGSLIAARLLE